MPEIRIYTTRWCGYCVRAKALLDARGLPYEEVALDVEIGFRQRLLDDTGGWTVPQIVLDGKPIVIEGAIVEPSIRRGGTAAGPA